MIELRLAEERDRAAHGRGVPRLLTVLLRTAIFAGTERWLDRALYQIGRISERTDHLDRLEKLTRVAKLSLGRDTDRALALADALGPFDDFDLESIRQSARIMAARSGPTNRTSEINRSVESWAQAQNASRVTYQLRAAWAWEASSRGEYDRATELAQQGLEQADTHRMRALALITVGTFALEAHRLDLVRETAGPALEIAYAARHAHFAVRAESLLRCAAYRADATRDPDVELVDAVAFVRVPNIEGIVTLTEGAVAWRAGDTALARELALLAEACWKQIGQVGAAVLARCLAVVCGHQLPAAEFPTIIDRIRTCPDSCTQFQAAGLLLAAAAAASAEDADAAAAGVAGAAGGGGGDTNGDTGGDAGREIQCTIVRETAGDAAAKRRDTRVDPGPLNSLNALSAPTALTTDSDVLRELAQIVRSIADVTPRHRLCMRRDVISLDEALRFAGDAVA
jgi:hypothetical protein